MNIEERFSALEKRLQAAEGESAITRLLTDYGLLMDSAEADRAARV